MLAQLYKHLSLIPLKHLKGYNILIISDMHNVFKDPSNRINFIERQALVRKEIIRLVKANKIKCVIFLGDIIDRGVSSYKYSVLEEVLCFFKSLYDLTDGQVYTVFGNHEFTYSQDNIYYLITEIQDTRVKELLEKERPNLLKKPIFPLVKVVPMLDFGDVHIHFVHFHPTQKDYTIVDDAPYVIGLYHDDFITYETQQKLYHHKEDGLLNISKINTFECVNYAIMGHIHVHCETVRLDNFRNTIIEYPGVATARTVKDAHTTVNLPVISLDKDVTINHVKLHLGELEESINQEARIRQESQKELRKLLKLRANVKGCINISELADKASNNRVKALVLNANKQHTPKCVDYYMDDTKVNKEELLSTYKTDITVPDDEEDL